MNSLERSLETETDKKLKEKDEIIKDLEREVGLDKKDLPKELRDKGWILNGIEILIPYTSDIYWCCKVNPESKKDKRLKKWLISWKYHTDKETYLIGEEFHGNIFINRTSKEGDTEIANRNKVMGRITKEHELPRGFKKVKEYWDSQVKLLNKNNVEEILINNFKTQKNAPEETQESNEKSQYKTFPDYPEHIQKEAIGIIESNNFMDESLNCVGWKHEGNRKTAKLLLLGCASLVIGEPVHEEITKDKGLGKTDINTNVKDQLPDQYVVNLTSFSSKALYYGADEDLHPLFNFIFLDDIVLDKDKIELTKLITDNTKTIKEHITVIDGKRVKFTLPGSYWVSSNRAKDDRDEELYDRFYSISLSNKKKHSAKVKLKILDNNVRNNKKYVEKINLILKCAWQYLIDNRKKVYNPYLMFLDVREHSNRNIGHYTNLIKANTFINQSERKKLNNIWIGNMEDINTVLSDVTENYDINYYELNNTDKLILEYLKSDEKDNTYQTIARAIGKHSSTVKKSINGDKESGIVGLETKGLINKDYVDPDNIKKGVYISFNKDEYTTFKTKISIDTLDTFQKCLVNNKIKVKWNIIINYLEWLHILINERVYIYLNKYLIEKETYNLENYDEMIKFLEKATELIKDECIIIEDSEEPNFKNNITLNEFNYHKNFVEKYKSDIYISSSSENYEKSIEVKNPLNQKQTKKKTNSLDTPEKYPQYRINKEQRREIHQLVFENVQIKKIRQKPRLIESIAPIHDDSREHFRIIARELEFLEDEGYIEIDRIEIRIIDTFHDYYYNNLKK
jgi:hypothetical protein